jgi:ribose 5-phosphate isomerase B
MTPPKRAIFSLNVNTNAEHFYERIEDHLKDDKVTVREHKEPLVGNTSVHILTKPFEKKVQRSVTRAVDGRVVRDTETYDSSSSKSRSGCKSRIEDKYDISDL